MAVPQLTFEEARVFGCLIEKSQATPEYYPMTLNALTNACNQKTSRDPVVEFDEDIVEEALDGLREKGLVAYASGLGRTLKYIHRAGQNGLGLTPAQAAIISLLILRGPQTTGELKARSGRQFNFPDIESVETAINGMMAEEKAFVECIPRRPGQKEDRYRHRFIEYQEEAQVASGAVFVASAGSVREELQAIQEKVQQIEVENKELKDRVARLEHVIQQIRTDLY